MTGLTKISKVCFGPTNSAWTTIIYVCSEYSNATSGEGFRVTSCYISLMILYLPELFLVRFEIVQNHLIQDLFDVFHTYLGMCIH